MDRSNLVGVRLSVLDDKRLMCCRVCGRFSEQSIVDAWHSGWRDFEEERADEDLEPALRLLGVCPNC